jgi:hypothetical protein
VTIAGPSIIFYDWLRLQTRDRTTLEEVDTEIDRARRCIAIPAGSVAVEQNHIHGLTAAAIREAGTCYAEGPTQDGVERSA